ncbi:immunity protein YezG family protein [Listeria ivanovii]|uniref:immunity protein YezG family protein n=1 Tax=Listeria ivanovii TaxID=1638 RepID=UPI0005128858|nr:immunity protein YezG family protein [Listeria ivanovii]AIS61320.1 cytoplasmic protein [Listeria ivanovii subsp. londoniensis]MBK1966153.1 DUF600 family protein [Listeria ivanovii subsp. londoniensis]MBK1985939.1 DUF600 family protein [Listeria ivanovii subsp. londoniensis]MBK1995869.1 DUF600 family protein [Listeria ivanovii subsp. londoniensis]
MEKTLNLLYKEIAEIVNQMIPEQWEEFYFYAQISKTGGGVYFFYKSQQHNDYVYSLDILKLFNVNEKDFKKHEYELYKKCKSIYKIFEENEQELWYSFTMSLEKTGRFKMHYDYTNWFDTEYSFSDQMIIWKYKYLNEKPEDRNLQKKIDKYLEEFPSNPI